MPFMGIFKIEEWCENMKIDAQVNGFAKIRNGVVVYMKGECFHCRNPDGSRHVHHSNHWVILQTGGYLTCRLRCHAAGVAKEGPANFPLTN